jgi:hypothetical protein
MGKNRRLVSAFSLRIPPDRDRHTVAAAQDQLRGQIFEGARGGLACPGQAPLRRSKVALAVLSPIMEAYS